ncbi:peptidoglycan DD-metalloendopeptidase family protein [Nostocoides sp. F2B08]|uniref:M23 family metallopeptidase n=1 Tax=Nostocoides sp. F2B08 TaxID=2653936 RepID=UPI0012636894|nr:M23 family metallopeptidase [Tetrasphaera sp. F2B08]KAB7744811.1 peptidoglycan DD-metalloendopeptidase family protein [Tetrasphaera sp. F2B08]
MRRRIAGLSTWWLRLFVLSVLILTLADLPGWVSLLPLVLIALALVRPPRVADPEARWIEVPVRGRWVGLNSPADKVPSHGVRAYGQEYAIDILHPADDGAPTTLGWGLGLREPETFSCFGEPVHAVADGVVVAADDRLDDQRSRSSWPTVIWMMTVGAFVRELAGPRFILGNHVVLDHGEGVYSAYAHLRHGSLRVAVGGRVTAGQQLAEVGNTGNSSEPHLHLQLMDRAEVNAAAGLPFRWRGIEINQSETDRAAGSGESTPVVEGLPAAGQVFTAHSG